MRLIAVSGNEDEASSLEPGPSVTERTFGIVPDVKRSLEPWEMRQLFEAAVTDETMQERSADHHDDQLEP